MHDNPPASAGPVDWRRVWTFYVLAYAATVLVSTPLWVDPRGLSAPYFWLLALVAMWTPALAAWVTDRSLPGSTCFGLSRPRALLQNLALALALPTLFSLAAIALGAWFGVYAFDPAHSRI